MTENRDFKGVWIPREIWLCEELSAIDKVIYTEIDSLDNESNYGCSHCTASNEYLANFCDVSEATVTRSIQKLIEKGYIERVSFDGRHRVLKVIKQTRQIDESESSKCSTNNIDNNTSNKNKSNNKLLDIITTQEKPKKKNLYTKCDDYIVQYTNNIILQEKLREYLNLRLEIAKNENKPFYYNMWPAIVNKLDELASDTDTTIKVIEQSIKNGWKGFYPLKDYSKRSAKSDPSERNVVSDKRDEKELQLSDTVY